MKTAREMVEEAQKEGDWRSGALTIRVRIVDIRTVWNRTDYQVTPVCGSGLAWVCADRVSFDRETS